MADGAELTIGIDEAGRGAHVGPLVLAAVALTSEQSDWLIAAGLRDSKPISPRRRTALTPLLIWLRRGLSIAGQIGSVGASGDSQQSENGTEPHVGIQCGAFEKRPSTMPRR